MNKSKYILKQNKNFCKKCHLPITKNNKHFPYCSSKCKRKVETKPIQCLQCNKEFIPKTNTTKYCSSHCSSKAAKEKLLLKNPNYFKNNTSFHIYKRDNFKCVYCGISAHDGAKLCIDHIYPLSKGGENDPFNLVTTCTNCNSQKFNTLLTQTQTLTLWERNTKIDIETELYLSYEKLKTEFDKIYKSRITKTNK